MFAIAHLLSSAIDGWVSIDQSGTGRLRRSEAAIVQCLESRYTICALLCCGFIFCSDDLEACK
ncbi:MAG: hypothetical protein ACI9JZ_002220 [Lentimonas sp.]|jgi:hypothetical protein